MALEPSVIEQVADALSSNNFHVEVYVHKTRDEIAIKFPDQDFVLTTNRAGALRTVAKFDHIKETMLSGLDPNDVFIKNIEALNNLVGKAVAS